MMQRVVGAIPQTFKNNALYTFLKNKYVDILTKRVSRLYCDYESIKRFYNKDKRIFIIGTGPSLLKTRLDLLEHETVMGVNTLFNEVKCSYYVVSDGVVFAKYWKEILSLDCPIFLPSWAGIEYLIHLRRYNKLKRFYPVAPIRDLTFDTVIISALYLACVMGFKKIYLVGCDFDYSGKEHFNDTKVVSKTIPYITGDYTEIFNNLEFIGELFPEVKIYNATVGGKLEVFPRISLEKISGLK